MAQRTIHYLFGEMIFEHAKLTDKKRFLLGSILPDAIAPPFRNASHFKVNLGTRKYFDFEVFRTQFTDQILHDDLYLGYYMHLVEDAFYRVFFYNDRFTMPRVPEEVPILHNDYHILNSYIVRKYNIRNILEGSFSLEREPLRHIAPFLLNDFLEQLAHDFTEQTAGNPVFLTESMLDEYVKIYIPLAIEEVNNIRNGRSVLKSTDYAWSANR